MCAMQSVCLIKCARCKTLFPSVEQYLEREKFFTSIVVKSYMKCLNCRQLTYCTPERMFFRDVDGVIHSHDAARADRRPLTMTPIPQRTAP